MKNINQLLFAEKGWRFGIQTKSIRNLLLFLAGGLFGSQSFAQAALAFDGSNDYVSVPYNAALNTNTFTFQTWVKIKGGQGSYRAVLSNRTTAAVEKGFILYAGDNNNWLFWTGTGSSGWNALNSSTAVVLNQWVNIAGTYDGATMKLYVNGTLAGSLATTTFVPNPSSDLRIGAGGGSTPPDFYANSEIDEVRIWNTARTQAEIQSSMNCELPGAQTGLQVYYKFNESSGTALTDATSNAFNGTLNNFALTGSTSNWIATGGVTTGGTCTTASALDFDGSNDYVQGGTIAAFNSANKFTYEAWVYNTALGVDYVPIVSVGGAFDVARMANGNFYAFFYPDVSPQNLGQTTTTPLATLNTWVHIAVVFDGTATGNANRLKIYVNGALQTLTFPGTIPATTTASTNPLRLGKYDVGTGNSWTGRMDEARFWNVARTAAEISSSMNCELVGNESGLKAYYKFNQGTVGANNAGTATLTDASGNNNNGTLTNFSLSGNTSNWVAPGGVTSGTTCATASITGPTSVCGNSVTLTASGGNSYAWTGGATTAAATFSASGTYTVTVTSGGGSTATASQTVTINPAPTATISGATTGCASVVLTASGGNSYAWTGGATTAAATFSASGTYIVTVTDANGCTATASETVTVNAFSPAISGGTTGCDNLTLTASGGISYEWSNGSSTAATNFTESGTYIVTVTAASGCTGTVSQTITIQASTTYFADADGDGYGNSNAPQQFCTTPPPSLTLVGGDCDDSNAAVKPGATENCDNVDDNCNGILVEGACPGSDAEVSSTCGSLTSANILTAEIFFNFGSTSNALNAVTRANVTVGQPLVGGNFGQDVNTAFGFWSRFLIAPSAPSVSASEGDLADRVQVNWKPDPLSPAATTFNIYRNNALLASVASEIRSFIDFNVLAGEFYTYEVEGVNEFGQGYRGSALGFLNPNGVVTGQVKTFSGNPVLGATVTLSPTIGTAIEFNGTGTSFVEYRPAFPREEFTLSTWVKLGDGNNSAGIFDMGKNIGKNWWLHTLSDAEGKGVKFGIGKNLNNKTEIGHEFPTATASDWHNVTASFNGSAVLLYIDGELVGTAVGEIEADSAVLFIGKRSDTGGYLIGKMDEFRMFDRQLSQTEIQQYMSQSVSSNTPGLVAYWKFDEGTGSKGFDISTNRFRTYLCGAEWTSDKPNVVNAGTTDATGFYKIEGINYSAGTTFTAAPSKTFYFNQSLEFNGANQNYADLTNFDLPDSSTIDLVFKNFDFSANQALLSKQNGGTTHFSVNVIAGNLYLEMGGASHDFGAVGTGFQRLSFVVKQTGLASGETEVSFYKNGTASGSHTFTGVAADFSGGSPWTLGAKRNGANFEKYFTGLIDEVAFFSTLLPLSDIQTFANIGTNVAHEKLQVYFNLNEGQGAELHDMGTALSGNGATHGALWSTLASISSTLPHEFTPSSRLVTLNPSNTSADQIDFTDQSTISVSGYVRFEGTTCFQKGVEILVNGQSHTPTIYTDAQGKFTADFEPGESPKLSPNFKDHTFYPPFWELQNLSTPVAGILFRNQTKRKVFGQVAGNEICRKSVIPAGAIVKVKVATLNNCYEQVKQLPANGKFTFEGVPPDSVTVAIIEHSNPIIYTFFQNKGGATLDLRATNDTTDFIYLAPPNVEMTALDTNFCGAHVIEQAGQYRTTVKVYEQYDGGKCYLDTALLTFNNVVGDLDQFDTLMTTGSLVHKFKAGYPNIVPPFLKTLQVTAEAHDEQATATQSTVVLGRRARQTTFASTAPEIPTLILRDPPGDASSAYIEKGSTTCQTWSFSAGIGVDFERSATLHLAPDFTTSVGVGAETEIEVDNTADLGFEQTISFNHTTSGEGQSCVTTTEVISTGDNDLVVGSSMGGDVYMGGAMNYLFGITDELKIDSMTCSPFLDKGLTVFPDGFATTFIYSEYHILDVVIPNLELIGDMSSANRWRDIIALNNAQKASAVFVENRSFDAGVVVEQSTTTDVESSISHEFVLSVNSAVSAEFGVTANGVGISAGIKLGLNISAGGSFGSSAATSRTVGYTLADDDIGDNFTVNIKKDKVYGTPVFDLVAGQSQCPHEPNTQPREGVSIAADAQVAVNVPKNDVAVFKLTLGNTSQSEETKFYTLEGLQENNPDGAVIRFNGQPALNVGVPFGQPVVVTMTVARGPLAFNYENLRIGYFSDCEVERADALGIDPPAEQNKEMEFDVFFIEPCSPVEVGFPLQDWVHLAASGTFMNITINDYNKADPDLELVRVQYRRSQGDGAWINIAEVPKADLGAVFEIVQWNLPTSFKDGFYEIRAVTQCFSGALNPGISKVVKGKIERTPPEIFGTPEPADGVLSAADEISVMFTEEIRCDQLIQADQFDNNNIGLYNTRTGDLVDAVITCNLDKITIIPNVPNQFIENDVLRVELDNIKDLVNNNFLHGQWEFVVDKNNLNWVDNVAVYVSKYEEEIKTETRRIENRGGFNQNYEITGGPDWVRIFPKSGTLAPGQVQVITFEFDSTMVFGVYSDTIKLEGSLGDEPLQVKGRIVCHDKNWQVNAGDWDYSENFTVQLNIETVLSNDVEDVVAAFVGGELRGTAKLEYVPAVNKYEAFLTVYSNQFAGETVTFQIWDASACLLYGSVLENFAFEADGLQGSPQTPTVLHTNNMVLGLIELSPGWNWISFNLGFANNSLGSVLASVTNPAGDLIKSQTQFAQYDAGFGWLGSLGSILNPPMYQYRTADADSILQLGTLIDPTTVNISVAAGWNWIGFVPQFPLTVNEALASLTPLNGDLIKSQTQFAQYLAGFGWIGNLKYMSPPNGYLLKMASAGTLTYPNAPVGGKPGVGGADANNGKLVKIDSRNSVFQVDATKFEHSQTLIAMLENAGSNVTGKDFELGAFVGNECRGAAKAIWIEPLQAHLFFITIYSNTTGELLKFKFYDGKDIFDLSETMYFSADAAVGTVQNPFKFSSTISAAEEVETEIFQPFLDVLPNPISDYATIRFRSPEAENVRFEIADAAGKAIQVFEYQAIKGMNAMLWQEAGELPQGVYLLKMTAGSLQMTEKVVVR